MGRVYFLLLLSITYRKDSAELFPSNKTTNILSAETLHLVYCGILQIIYSLFQSPAASRLFYGDNMITLKTKACIFGKMLELKTLYVSCAMLQVCSGFFSRLLRLESLVNITGSRCYGVCQSVLEQDELTSFLISNVLNPL